MAADQEVAAQPVPREDPARPVRILLVDDRPENLLALEAILTSLDHELVRAGSGEEALKALLTTDFALILLDASMPGMDGFETAARIKRRERTRDIPILFLTAYQNEPQHAFRGYEVGAVDYLTKPFDPWILRAKVSVFVDLYLKNRQLQEQAALLRQQLSAVAGAAGRSSDGSACRGPIRSRQTASTTAARSSSVPALLMSTSATARRSASLACAAIRARASSAGTPRAASRASRAASGASTTTTRSYCPASPFSTSSGTSRTTTASGGVAASSSAVRSATSGCTIAFSRRRAAWSANTIEASRARSNRPSAPRTPGPNSASTACRPRPPGSTTSRAMASASTTTAPCRASRPATALLPAPIPPVSPTFSIRGSAVGLQRRGSAS